jgi:hypothetical protein
MVRELYILDKEISRANNFTLMRTNFEMYERDFKNEFSRFGNQIEKTAKKEKRNNVIVVAITIA